MSHFTHVQVMKKVQQREMELRTHAQIMKTTVDSAQNAGVSMLIVVM